MGFDSAAFRRGVCEVNMTGAEYSRKLDELDRLLNDPDAPLQPDRVWCLLAEVSRSELAAAHRQQPAGTRRPAAR